MTREEEFINIVSSKLPKIPEHITEEWLVDNLNNNEMFRIWGFSYSDLSNSTFGNISEEVIRRVPISTKTILPTNNPFDLSIFTKDRSVTNLNKEGIDGRGVNIVVIDQPINPIHNEISGRVNDYSLSNGKSAFHGLVVSSMLVGNNLGLIPNNSIGYYGVNSSSKFGVEESMEALKDIYNRNLNGENIKVVSISGYIHTLSEEYSLIKGMLESQGCYIIDANTFGSVCTCINKYNSDGVVKYKYSSWQKENIDEFKSKVAVSFDGISPLFETENDYLYGGEVSYSWVIPKLSGIFAMCLQVNPNLTLEEFKKLVVDTKRVNEDGISMINPEGMIEVLMKDLVSNKSL